MDSNSILAKNLPSDSPKYSFQNILSQNFSLPKTIISYCFHRKCQTLLEHSSPEYFFKLYSTCKYFFAKIRLISCHYLSIATNYLFLHCGFMSEEDDETTVIGGVKISHQKCKEINIHFLPSNISTALPSTSANNTKPDLMSKLIPRLCNFNLLIFHLQNQELTLKEYSFLTINEKCNVYLHDCNVIAEVGNRITVPVEELLRVSPRIEQFSLSCSRTSQLDYCTSKTAQKLAALPPMENLNDFVLYNVPESFDALSFVQFIKNIYKPKTTSAEIEFYRFILEFKDGVDASVVEYFKEIVDSAVAQMKTKEKNLLCIIYP